MNINNEAINEKLYFYAKKWIFDKYDIIKLINKIEQTYSVKVLDSYIFEEKDVEHNTEYIICNLNKRLSHIKTKYKYPHNSHTYYDIGYSKNDENKHVFNTEKKEHYDINNLLVSLFDIFETNMFKNKNDIHFLEKHQTNAFTRGSMSFSICEDKIYLYISRYIHKPCYVDTITNILYTVFGTSVYDSYEFLFYELELTPFHI